MGIHVAFDIGNVLCHFDIKKFTSKLSEVVGISDHDAYFFLARLQAHQDIGITSVATELEFQYKLSGTDICKLIECWNSTVTPNLSMMNFLENLRSDGVKIAFLSNMGPEHIEHLRSIAPKMFDKGIQHISCEVGARKPTKLFFQSFVEDHAEFQGCVYIDDIEANLKAGKHYGFKVYGFNLDEHMKLTMSQQKTELTRLKNMIINMIPNSTSTKIYNG